MKIEIENAFNIKLIAGCDLDLINIGRINAKHDCEFIQSTTSNAITGVLVTTDKLIDILTGDEN